MNDSPRAIGSALTQCILRFAAVRQVLGFCEGGCSPEHQPGNKRIPQITHLIANLLFIFFFWNVCRAHFLCFVLTEMDFLSTGLRGVTLAFLDPAVWGRQLGSFFMFCLNRDGIFEHGPGSGRTMTWQENGRFYYAALLASDTPGHPGISDTNDICCVL